MRKVVLDVDVEQVLPDEKFELMVSKYDLVANVTKVREVVDRIRSRGIVHIKASMNREDAYQRYIIGPVPHTRP